MFKSENGDKFPFVGTGDHSTAVAVASPAATTPSAVTNSTMADAFALVAAGQAAAYFICPSDGSASADAYTNTVSGTTTTWGTTFSDGTHNSYGWQAPITTATAGVYACGIDDANASTLIMADKPATNAGTAASNSKNHGQDYSNGLTAGLSVVRMQGSANPFQYNGDNIYTASNIDGVDPVGSVAIANHKSTKDTFIRVP